MELSLRCERASPSSFFPDGNVHWMGTNFVLTRTPPSRAAWVRSLHVIVDHFIDPFSLHRLRVPHHHPRTHSRASLYVPMLGRRRRRHRHCLLP